MSSSLMRTLCAAFTFATLFGAFIGGAGNAYANGNKAWQIVPSTNGIERFNQLSGVTAVSKDNVWAVGRSFGFSSFNHSSNIGMAKLGKQSPRQMWDFFLT